MAKTANFNAVAFLLQEMLHPLACMIMEAAVIFVYYPQPVVGVHAPLTLLWLEMRRLVNIKVS